MQGVWVLKDATQVVWLGVALAISVVGLAPSAAGQESSQIPVEKRGVVVEAVGEGSALEKAGLRPGDVLFAWERLPTPPANPKGTQGTIASVFDWMWLEVEQAPRGAVRLMGQRGGEAEVFEVAPGEWKATPRPRMPAGLLEEYARGKELGETEGLEAGIDPWQNVAGAIKSQASDRHLRCWILFRIGNAWGQARRWEKAHGAYRSALVAAQDPLAKVTIFQAIGDAYEQASDFESARAAYGSAQEIRERIWSKGLAFARGLNDLGRLDAKQGRLEAAQGYLRRALEIRQKLAPSSLDVADSLLNLGTLAYSRGDFDWALNFFERSLNIQQELAPGSLNVAMSLNNLGLLARQRSDLVRATEYHEGALEIRRKLAPYSLGMASSLNNLGNSAYIRGDWNRAVQYYEEALEIKQKLAPDSLDVAMSLHNLGNLAHSRSDWDQATECYERSLEIRRKLAPNSLDVAMSLNSLGNLAYGRGDLDRAVEYYEWTLEIQQKLAPRDLDTAGTLNNLGNLTSRLGDLDRALEYYKRALEIQQMLAPDSLAVAASVNNLGLLANKRGDLDQAREHYGEALDIRKRLAPGNLDMASSLYNLGFLESTRGDWDQATEYYRMSLEIRKKLSPGSSAVAGTLYALAKLRREQSQPKLALGLFLQALQALENQIDMFGGSRGVQASFRAKRVAYYRHTIDQFLEFQQLEEAFHVLERSRARSFLDQLAERDPVFSDVPEELEWTRRQIGSSYDETQSEIAKLHPREQAEEIEDLLSQLRKLRRDYEDITEKIIDASPKLRALRYPQPLELDAARQTLDPGTLMLSYSIDRDETHLFILTREEALRTLTLPIGEDKLRGDVEKVLELQRRRSAPLLYTRPLHQAGERLYEALIQPVEESIAQSDRVLIVPDGPLHLLPFALLVRNTGPGESHGDRDFEYLVEWKPLHSVLSATVFAELKSQRRSQPGEGGDALALAAFGDPRYPSANSRADITANRSIDVYVRAAAERGFDFRSLPYSREEVHRIADLYPEDAARIYVGPMASEKQAKSVGKSARILHFAAHGRFNDRFPLDSYLALTIPREFRKDHDNGLLQAWEIFESVRLDADLVVLSACESGVGEEVASEGLKGLTRAFQFAGARTVAATLWQVDDQATAELMVRFYRYLKAGMPKDEALRVAQLELIRGPIEVKDRQGRVVQRDFSLPYYWAAFQLIGDWQ